MAKQIEYKIKEGLLFVELGQCKLDCAENEFMAVTLYYWNCLQTRFAHI